jgi:glycosidase
MAEPLAVFSSMWKGIPLIYSGQELPNKKRLLFFDKDEIKWSSLVSLHDFYKSLLTFRKYKCLSISSDENSIVCFTSNSVEHHVLSFVRKIGSLQMLVIINFSEYDLSDVKIEVCNDVGVYRELFTEISIEFSEKYHHFSLRAWEYQVWYK